MLLTKWFPSRKPILLENRRKTFSFLLPSSLCSVLCSVLCSLFSLFSVLCSDLCLSLMEGRRPHQQFAPPPFYPHQQSGFRGNGAGNGGDAPHPRPLPHSPLGPPLSGQKRTFNHHRSPGFAKTLILTFLLLLLFLVFTLIYPSVLVFCVCLFSILFKLCFNLLFPSQFSANGPQL